MRKRLEKFLDEINGYCTEDLIEDAESALGRLCYHYRDKYGSDWVFVMWGILASAIKADGEISYKERYFLSESFEMHLVDSMIDDGINRYEYSQSQVIDFMDELPYELQCDLVFVLICVCGADDRISRGEYSFVKSLLRRL